MLWLLILFVVIGNIGCIGLLFQEVQNHIDLYPSWKDRKVPQSALIYIIIMVCISIAMTIFVTLFYVDNTWLFTLKRVLLLVLLWPIAYTDFMTFRIPNRFIVAGLLSRVVVLVIELICSAPKVWQTLLIEVIASVVLVVVALFCTLLIKNGIGYGDMKLFIVMGLFLGLEGTWGAIFLSLIISFIIAVVLLARKKKSRKDAIPFGPAIMIGTYLSVFLTGM